MTKLKAIATHDNLTNIYNKAIFHDFAINMLKTARKQKALVLVLEIDIDHFKMINDTYGHFCGDEIIKNLVKKLAGCLRDEDIFGCVGEEEFNVLLQDTNLENAIDIAKNLRKMVAVETFLFYDHQIHAEPPYSMKKGIQI